MFVGMEWKSAGCWFGVKSIRKCMLFKRCVVIPEESKS